MIHANYGLGFETEQGARSALFFFQVGELLEALQLARGPLDCFTAASMRRQSAAWSRSPLSSSSLAFWAASNAALAPKLSCSLRACACISVAGIMIVLLQVEGCDPTHMGPHKSETTQLRRAKLLPAERAGLQPNAASKARLLLLESKARSGSLLWSGFSWRTGSRFA